MLMQSRPMKEAKVLSERIDRNGTKHQVILTNCDRCGGAGAHEMWRHTGGTCYKCAGSGRMEAKRKIYTPEHEEKLRKLREKRQQKRIEKIKGEAKEKNKELLKEWGYDQENIYIVLGETYPIREELKKADAFWGGRTLGWFFAENPEDYDTAEIKTSELVWYNTLGSVNKKNPEEYREYVESVKRELEYQSQHVGTVGEKIELEFCVLNAFWIETQFGSSCINKLSDEQGNIFIWKTGKNLEHDADENGIIKLKGTIKEHSEYKGELQTVLTRCRVK
ncbi:hypothetical protein V7094_28595 [Priestia megaterium]|uniref:hypothetical protein n=1 Tax=Priestia megaterium TaxID=1404 RepID=UPI003000C50A